LPRVSSSFPDVPRAGPTAFSGAFPLRHCILRGPFRSRPAPGLLQSGSRGSPRAPALLLAPLLGWPLFHVKHVQLCVWAAASFREIGCPSPAPVAENALEAARDTDGQSPRPAVAERARRLPLARCAALSLRLSMPASTPRGAPGSSRRLPPEHAAIA